jgi:hypothetical protein
MGIGGNGNILFVSISALLLSWIVVALVIVVASVPVEVEGLLVVGSLGGKRLRFKRLPLVIQPVLELRLL